MDGSQYRPDIVRLASGDASVSTTAQTFSADPRVKALVEMSTPEWSAWYSRQYHTVATAERRIKDMLKSFSQNSAIFDIYEVRARSLGDLARLERLRELHISNRSRRSRDRLLHAIIGACSSSFLINNAIQSNYNR